MKLGIVLKSFIQIFGMADKYFSKKMAIPTPLTPQEK